MDQGVSVSECLVEAALAPLVKTANARQPEPKSPGPWLVDCLEHVVTCPGCVWTTSRDAERPLSPSSGPFCLLHPVPISHFEALRWALATGQDRPPSCGFALLL